MKWKWIAAGVGVIALFVLARVLPVTEWLKSFSQWAGQLGPAGIVVFILVYALATVLFVPGWPLTIGAGFAFGLIVGTIAVSLGSILGATLAFLIARLFARKQIEKLTARNERFQALDRAIGERGWKMIFLLRLSPIVPFNLSNYFYGITAVKFWPYFLASWVGMLPGTILYVYLGTVGKAGVEAASQGHRRSPWEWAALALGLLATIIVTIWVARLAQKALKRHHVAASKS